VHVDQSPIGRTPRSNPATYTGVFDHSPPPLRGDTEAKVRGYQPGRFSFNVKGGRCEACSGDGTIKIEMNFLPGRLRPVRGLPRRRYNRETLEVHFKGKTIADVLDMPIEEAAEFFAAVPAIARHLRTLVDVGLGYVRLGQPAPTLSGGEAQRVKLAAELQKRSTGRTVYVLDEPTTGPALRGHPQAARGTAGAGRQGQHGHRDRAQPRRDQERRLDDRPRPEGGTGGGLVVRHRHPRDLTTHPTSHSGRFLPGSCPTRRRGRDRRSAGGAPRPADQPTANRLGLADEVVTRGRT
jgi:excinuclease ABC subunit A